MAKRVDLSSAFPWSLPAVRVKKGSQSSSTPAPLLARLRKRVKFVAWPNFDEELKGMAKRMKQELTEEDLVDASYFMEAISREADPEPVSRETVQSVLEKSYMGASKTVNGVPQRVPDHVTRIFPEETSIVGMVSNIFNLCGSIVQRLVGSEKVVFRTKFERAGKVPGYEGTTATGRKGFLPDSSLMILNTSEDVAGTRVCQFELKGPEKNITGRVPKASDLTQVDENQGKSELIFVPDFEVGDSTEELVRRLNAAFDADRSTPRVSAESCLKPVAQTIGYALNTTSGCAYLTNYQDGIAMEVDLDALGSSWPEEDWKLTIKVGLVRMPTGGRNRCPGGQGCGQVEGIVYTSVYSCEKHKKNGSSIREKLQDIYQFIRHGNALQPREDMTSGRGNRGRGQKRKVTFPESTSADDTLKRSRRSTASSVLEKEQLEMSEVTVYAGSLSHESVSSAELSQDLPDARKDLQTPAWINSLRRMKTCEESRPMLQHFVEELFRNICLERSKIIGQGLSGIVLEEYWEGRKAAVKVWNQDVGDGLAELCTEIATYKFLWGQNKALLGEIVPDILHAWNELDDHSELEYKVGLIMDFVGHGIEVDNYERFWVDEDGKRLQLQEKDKDEIRNAALQNLRRLHDQGIAHGDISLRNVRVQRRATLKESLVTDGEPFNFWKVWLIDFGQSSLPRTNREAIFDSEMFSCERLFDDNF